MVATKQQAHMGSVARDFIQCASRAYLDYSDQGRQLLTIPVPAIVCYAFAAEVSLKLLHSLQGKTVRGHDLAQLFKSLPAAIKADLRARTQWPEADFFKELGRIATAFVEWRYVYESAGRALNFLFLKNFATAAQAMALEACPLPPPRVATVTLK